MPSGWDRGSFALDEEDVPAGWGESPPASSRGRGAERPPQGDVRRCAGRSEAASLFTNAPPCEGVQPRSGRPPTLPWSIADAAPPRRASRLASTPPAEPSEDGTAAEVRAALALLRERRRRVPLEETLEALEALQALQRRSRLPIEALPRGRSLPLHGRAGSATARRVAGEGRGRSSSCLPEVRRSSSAPSEPARPMLSSRQGSGPCTRGIDAALR
mmetsp:Transcript_107196/g.298081  ORF Transcript_107196/g.298081 Transcript_107196/m.298081 type:complete len:216 (+) Transcript_107196:58-705(+)